MKKGLLSLTLIACSLLSISAKGGDDVLMTVNGKPVTLNEFEYLFHKNNSQQLTPQSIDEYLEMFVTYKLKVADAEAAGIDTTAQFINEFDNYRRELAAPYLIDRATEDSIINSIYERMKEEVEVSHIMLASGRTPLERDAQRAMLDSLRNAIISGNADFADVAREYSIDRSAKQNGGRQGWIVPNRFPYVFEDAAYNTPVGEISPVVETPYGIHILKVSGRRPASGQVLVEHILKLTQGLSEEEKAEKKAQIDSIYALLQAGADFEELATKESEDPGSAKRGGKLNWFGPGQMVPEFEETSFSLADGATSEPFATAYGYHIVRRLDSKGVEDLETARPAIKNFIANDERGQLPTKAKVRQLMKKYGVKYNDKNIDLVRQELIALGGLDSAFLAKYANSDLPVATYGKRSVSVGAVIDEAPLPPVSPEEQAEMFGEAVKRVVEQAVVDLETENLASSEPEYRNLLNEYRDGILLFDISDRNVWAKSKEDKEGLEAYFNANRDKYAWEKPKFKSFIVFATSDSIANAAHEYLMAHDAIADADLAAELRKQFGKDVRLERVIAAQGENPITDFLAFGGEKPKPMSKWAYYFAYRGRIIDQPEEAADERGVVTSDYQADLERQWVDRLKKKYAVKINDKVLKKAK